MNIKPFRIISVFFILILLNGCQVHTKLSTNSHNALWYQNPANDWGEALPIGNGKLGAMVHGQPHKEQLQLNEESLWGGCPEDPIPENAKEHYTHFQKLNLEGKYQEALAYGMKYLAISPTSIRSYQTFGDLFITFENHQNVTNYKRSLDLQTGIVTVSYEINNKRFIRESFISTKYNTIVHHFKSLDNAPVTSKINYHRVRDTKQSIENNKLIIDGQIFDDPKGYDDNPGGSGKGGYHTKFAGIVAVSNNSGSITHTDNTLIINDTKKFTVFTAASTDYNIDLMSFDRSINPLKTCQTTLEQVNQVDYETIKSEHIAYHQAMMDRVVFDITNNQKDTIPTDVRLKNLKNNTEDKFLTELLFQYGRYLLLGSSGGNSLLPANLQGIWNKEMWAAWDSDFHLNINLQMNYWPAEITNLSETTKPLSVFMKNLSEKGKVTASKFIDTEGWMAHHVSNPFGRTTASGSTKHSQVNNGYCFPLAGAWMSLSLWRHYEFTEDTEYLKNTAYPIIKGAAQFILDFLKENDKGELVTAPSYSPENDYIHPKTGKQLKNTIAAAIDIQIIKDVFAACLKAETILQQKTKLSDNIPVALQKLPKTKIGKDGTIQEWYEDYKEAEIGHRHMSHLYALFPSNQITENTPKLFEAAKKTIKKRLSAGGGQTGWSRAWITNFYARLYNGDVCNHHITNLLKHQVTPNLFDIHPPKIFQIDGNLGITSGIAEMFLQSHQENTIRILPALPSTWKNGHMKGLKARGNLTVDIYWENNKPSKVIIYPNANKKISVIYQDKKIDLTLTKGKKVTLSDF